MTFFLKKEKGINVFRWASLKDGHVSRFQNRNVLSLLLKMLWLLRNEAEARINEESHSEG